MSRIHGWTPYRPGIIDTGAAITLLPKEAWLDTDHQVIGDVLIGGVNAKPECRIRAKFATLDCILSDGRERLGPQTIHAYLAESNEVPLLIGISGLIESGVLMLELKKDVACFEF
ncbi:MAG: hypothetical protein IPK83_05490 [Planctomycetes bacterium]|nr:hypothetical protein [Planctomycetota bacterium]